MNARRIETARAARELADRRLDAERKRFDVGISTSFLVIQAQRDMAQARTGELAAILAYDLALVDFDALQQAGPATSSRNRFGPANWTEAVKNESDHFDGRRFFNPTRPAAQPFSAVPRMLRERRTPWPARIDVPPQQPPRARWRGGGRHVHRPRDVSDSDRGRQHPDRPDVLRARGSVANASGRGACGSRRCAFDDLPPIAIVLLSHNHYDHCDLPTLRALARRFDPLVVTPLGNAPLVRSAGIRRVEELDWWQDATTRAAADHADAGASFLGARRRSIATARCGAASC